MIELLFTSKNKIIGIDELGYFIGILDNDTVAKRHHLTEKQFKELVARWIK